MLKNATTLNQAFEFYSTNNNENKAIFPILVPILYKDSEGVQIFQGGGVGGGGGGGGGCPNAYFYRNT